VWSVCLAGRFGEGVEFSFKLATIGDQYQASQQLYKYKYICIIAMRGRSVVWVGSSRRDLCSFPREVRRDLGQALYAAQQGEVDPAAKPLRGFGGGSVLEIVARHDGDAWRAVYTVRYAEAVYVLHAFQKKSKTGIATPKKEMDLIHRRLVEAERLHRERQN